METPLFVYRAQKRKISGSFDFTERNLHLHLKNISLINEACVLYHDAKSIYPDGVHIAGDVESLANSFNKFAKKIKNDKIELCSKFDDGLGTLTECGRKILKTVKRELEIYIRNNKINCNQ